MATTDAPGAAAATPGLRRRYFPELEGMRGLAALGVLITHVAFSSRVVNWTEAPGLEQEGMGVFARIFQQFHVSLPIFFILSGMLLYRPFALSTLVGTPKPALKSYLWRRALRTLPAYWALVVVTLVLLNREGIHSVWQVVRPLLLLQIYQAEARMTSMGIEQTWSLATEVAFYAALPLLAWVLHRIARGATGVVARARRILWALTVPLLIGAAFTAYTHRAGAGVWPQQQEWPFGWIGYIAVGMGLATLAAAAEVSDENVFTPFRLLARKPILSWVGAGVVYVLACASPVGNPGSANYPGQAQAMVEHVLYLSFGLLIVAPLALPAHRHSRFITATLTNPVMLFLGRISYGIYLWHIANIYFWNGAMFGAPSFPLLLLQVLVSSIVLATLSYYIVERPAMLLRERLGKAPATPSVATVDPAVPAGRADSPAPAGASVSG